jgi:hypothetical protein
MRAVHMSMSATGVARSHEAEEAVDKASFGRRIMGNGTRLEA